MGSWGLRIDENDNIADFICEVLYPKTDDDDYNSKNEDEYRNFTKVFSLKELREFDYYAAFGLLVSLARGFRTDDDFCLPDNFPKVYIQYVHDNKVNILKDVLHFQDGSDYNFLIRLRNATIKDFSLFNCHVENDLEIISSLTCTIRENKEDKYKGFEKNRNKVFFGSEVDEIFPV
jgi:hypothetical protein